MRGVQLMACLLGAGGLLSASPASGQTFSQVLDLGDNVGARFTRTFTLQEWNKGLFFQPTAVVGFMDAASGGSTYMFTVDARWGRITYSKKDEWIQHMMSIPGKLPTDNNWKSSSVLPGTSMTK